MATWRNPPWHRLSSAFQHLRDRSPRTVLRAAATLLAVAVLLLVTGCAPAPTHTFVVNDPLDFAGDRDYDPGDGHCQTHGSPNTCSLRAAIEEANALSGTDTIKFNITTPGVQHFINADNPYPAITESLIIDGQTQPGYAGQPVIILRIDTWGSNMSVFIIDPGAEVTIRGLQIEMMLGDNSAIWNHGTLHLENMRLLGNTRHIRSDAASGTAVLTIADSLLQDSYLAAVDSTNTDITITGSSILENGTQDSLALAGGIILHGGTATIGESEIKRNTGWQSGGIYIDGAEVHIRQSAVDGNLGWDAGGIYVEPDGELWVEDGSWVGAGSEGNTAAIISDGNKFGGGIFSEGAVHISHSIIEGNSGAGIHSRGVDGNAVLDVADSDITHNSLAGIYAAQSDVDITGTHIRSNDDGGIFLAEGSLTVTESSISLNQNNGGIHVEAARLRIDKSTIYSNTASDKGGGVSLYATLGTAEIVNSTISGNQASNSGGGIAEVGGIVELKNATIAQNSSGHGGGLYNGIGTIKAINTILADNIGGNCEGTITSLGHNLDTRTTCGFAGPGDISNMNAILGPLQNYGGSTKTHALPNNSPALEAGDDAACQLTDQRGITRPQGLHCDMGAYETENPVTPTPPSITKTPRRSPTPTETPTLTAIGFLFEPVEYSDNPVFHSGKTCTVKQVTIRVKVSPADTVTSVGLFYRLESKSGDRIGEWGGGLAMTPEGGGWYRMTLNADDIPGIREWREDAILAIQFIANGAGEVVLARSPVHRELVLMPCTRAG